MPRFSHPILVCLTYGLICPMFELGIPISRAQTSQSIRLQSEISNVQPMTGIVLWTDHDKVETDAISLEFRYCGYNEVITSEGNYDFTTIEQILDGVAARGHQAILRFYFVYPGKKTTVPDFIRKRSDYQETTGTSEGKRTSFCDWSNKALQEFTLQFYSRFAQRYDNDPRLAYLQTGFGLWGEYHIYSGPVKIGKTFPSKSFQSQFARHLNQEFHNLPWSISIDSADSDYAPFKNSTDLLALKFGLFDDSFLCKAHPKENAINWKMLSSNRWKKQPAGGEISYYNNHDQQQALSKNGPNGVSFEAAAKQFHLSYIIGNDQPEYQSLDRIQSAGMATGYRFIVTQAVWQNEILSLTVTNEGVAPFYRDAFFAAGEHRSKTSLKGLLPGETLKCSIAGAAQVDLQKIAIQSDAILPDQVIQFSANLK